MMESKETKWVRMFDALDISKHPKGFTIYKIISMLYPENCPDAITKITVWKRFSDFKHLHKDMKILHKQLKIKDAYPSLSSTTYFKRFNDEIIQQRKELILGFLEYISLHSQLYTSNTFVKFFEMSYSKISERPHKVDQESASFYSHDSDDDCTISDDTDSVSTVSSSMIHIPEETKKMEDSYPIMFKIVLNDLEIFSLELFAISVDNIASNIDYYVADADKFFNVAEQAEKEKEFKVAWIHYMQGTYILLRFGKDDCNPDRRLKSKFKLEKFFIRLERLFYIHLYEVVRVYMVDNYGDSFANLILNDLNNLHFEQLINMQKFEPIYMSDSEKLLLTIKIGSVVVLNYPISNSNNKTNADNVVLNPDYLQTKERANESHANHKQAFMELLQDDSTKKQKLGHLLTTKKFSARESLNTQSKQPKSHLMETKKSRDLYNYKVISILGNSMILALQKDNEQTFIVEVIQKSHAHDNLVLPTNVPFMMKLQKWYETSDAIFLIIKHTNFIGLRDFLIKNHSGKTLDLDDQEPTKELTQSDNDYEFIDLPSNSDNCSIEDCDEYFENIEFRVPVDRVRKWAAQLVVALEKLHKNEIICCNLSMNDLHVDENDDICVYYKYKMSGDKTSNWTVDALCAPEVYDFKQVTDAADWWSLGTVLYELLVGLPLTRTHPGGIFNYTLLRFPKRVPYHGKNLVKQLLTFQPNDRLGSGPQGIDHLKSHAFFNNFDWTLS